MGMYISDCLLLHITCGQTLSASQIAWGVHVT